MPDRAIPPIHGPDHAPGGPDPIPFGNAVYAIEVVENDLPVVVGDDQFNWEIPEDLDEALLVKIEGYVNSASGSGSVQVQIRSSASGDLLSTKINVDAGDLNSRDSATQPVIDTSVQQVAWGDHLRVDVDAAGSGTLGLGIILYFAPASTAGVVIRGAKGDTGGVSSWTGQYSGSTTYVTNESVVNNGTSYVARVDNPTTEPGVDPGWEDEWQVIAERQLFTAVTFTDDNQGRVIDEGVKGRVWVPFDCTIVGYTLLSDFFGDLALDVWLADYGVYPPTVADSITGGNPPLLVAAQKTQDLVLTGWTTFVPADSVLILECTDLATLITSFSFTLKLQRN